jgi:hypothetical protein
MSRKESGESKSRKSHLCDFAGAANASGSPTIFPIGAPQVRNEASEHVSNVLVQTRNRDFFVRLDVLAFACCRQMSTRFKRRSAGYHEVVSEVTIGALAKPSPIWPGILPVDSVSCLWRSKSLISFGRFRSGEIASMPSSALV